MQRECDMLGVDGRIARIAAAQHGVVARGQLLRAGLGPDGVDHRLRSGRLHRLHRGVYAVGHTRLVREGRWMAAVLACGDRAALSHVSAAALWGLRASSAGATHVTVATSAGLRQRPGIALHRSRRLPEAEVARHRGMRVTSPARTLLDLAAIVTPARLERAVEQALALRLFDLAAVSAVLAAHRTRSAATTLAAVVAGIDDEPSLARSEAEALFLDVCAAEGIDRPTTNARVEGLEVDFSWRAQRVVVEIDGHRFHATRAAFERDRARDVRLTVAGFRVVRFTFRRLVLDQAGVAAVLRALLGPDAGYAAAASSSASSPVRSASAVSR